MLKDKTIIVGVCGGIAAYKACGVVSKLAQGGADVWVVMTAAATKLVTPLTFRTLSKNPVITDLFADELSQIPVPHVSLTDRAQLFLVVPATANIIGKVVNGIADDPLSTMLMAATCTKIFCPAMNDNMWNNAAVQENIEKVKKMGAKLLGPEVGHLACDKDESIGRMVEPETMLKEVENIFATKQDLSGRHFLITAGPTYEDLDPVRYIGNRSSGKMGYALAEAAAERGAQVTLVSGPTELAALKSVENISVRSAEEMKNAVFNHFEQSDTLIMAAAVADFAPAKVSSQKVKKGKVKTKLVKLSQTADILSELRKIKGKRKIVGFAAETENLVANAQKKLKAKGLDMIVANDVSKKDIGFGSDFNAVTIIPKKGKRFSLKRAPKHEIAGKILDGLR